MTTVIDSRRKATRRTYYVTTRVPRMTLHWILWSKENVVVMYRKRQDSNRGIGSRTLAGC